MPHLRFTCAEALAFAEADLRSARVARGGLDEDANDKDIKHSDDSVAEAELAVEAARNREGCL